MKILLTVISILTNLCLFAQNYSMENFSPTPILYNDEWENMVFKKGQFSVSSVNGQIQITKSSPTAVKEKVIDGGTLLALNLGDWEGGLYYKPFNNTITKVIVNELPAEINIFLDNTAYAFINPRDKSKELISGKYALIVKGNITDIAVNKHLLFLSADFQRTRGALHSLSVNNNKYSISKLKDFNSVSPHVINTFREKIYVIAGRSLYILGMDGTEEKVLIDIFTDGIYPTSLAAIDEKYIYIGLIGGYGKIDLTTSKLTFYLYNS